MAYSITVRVKGQPVTLSSESLNHEFKMADLVKACGIYRIPTENAVFKRDGKTLSSNDVIVNGDKFDLDFSKGGEGAVKRCPRQ